METLQDELDAFKAVIIENTDKEVIDNIGKQSRELTESGLVEHAIKKGDKAPIDFILPDVNGDANKQFDMEKTLKSGKRVILSFFKGGWCPYCTIELRALLKALPEFEAKGATLAAISPELPESSQNTAEQEHLTFHVLSDVDNVVAKRFRLTFKLANELCPVYTDDWKFDVPKATGNTKFELPLPATYVIDTDGTVLYSFIDADYTKRADPADILAALST